MENRLRQSMQTSASPYFKNAFKDTFQLNKNFSMMRSTISTSKSNNTTQRCSLDKVKIRTLPHHALANLGKNPNFMIVFQAIQIQRLSDQIETQRRKLRDLERQVVNASNYEVQIKQLSDKCTDLQEQIIEYQDELQKMNGFCQKLYHQNDDLKQKSKLTEKQLSQLKQLSKQNLQQRQQSQIIAPGERKSNLKKSSQILTKQIQYSQNSKSDKNYFKNLLQQSEQNLRQVNQKVFAIDKRDTDITQYELMIQGLSKQIQGALRENQKLHTALKETSSEADKWQKAAMLTSNANNTFYIFQKQSSQLTQKQKIDMLSSQILRLTELILSKNNKLLNFQQNIFNLSHQNQKLKDSINKSSSNFSNENIAHLQEQLQNLRTQHRLCQEKIKQKTDECNNMRRNQSAIFKDLEEINKIRLVCQNHQNSIMENLKDMERLKISNKNYEKLLAAEQLKNSQISMKLQQYLKRSNISKSNYFIQSACVHTGEFPLIKNPQKQSIQIVFERIKELQNTVKYLKQNYTYLLSRAGQLNSQSFPMTFSQSHYEY